MATFGEIPTEVQHSLLTPYRAEIIAALEGGLSGASIWKCKTSLGPACLRRWPQMHPSPERLGLIHWGMHAASASAITFTPKILSCQNGKSFLQSNGHLWELTTWCAGAADYLSSPSHIRLKNAMRALAALHDLWHNHSRMGISPTLIDRSGTLTRYETRLRNPQPDSAFSLPPDLIELRERTMLEFKIRCQRLQTSLRIELEKEVPLHFVLRDIWSDHVLFTGDEVTGIIDFGAARIDDPRTDIVRLLGSLEPRDRERWEFGLSIYREASVTRGAFEVEPLRLMDEVATLLAALQWMEWLVLERRTFKADPNQLLQRWRGFLDRLATTFADT